MDAKTTQFISKHYNHSDGTKKDIKAVVTAYRGLIPKIQKFVFNNGTEKELVCLDGTVPVPYKNNTYNIPVTIWLLETHPHNAPMVFVTPTADMKIKVSRHVDHNGVVYLPYLHTWSTSGSNLVDLIKVMTAVFSEQPPVYSVPKTQQPATHSYPSQPMMPMPGAGGYPPYTAHTQNLPYPVYPSSQPPYPGAAPSSMPPYPTVAPYPVPYPNQQQNQPAPTNTGTILPEHLRASLLSAVEDKIRRKLGEMSAAAQAEMDNLRRTGHELANGKQTLETIFRRLEAEQAEIDRNIAILTEKEAELDKLVSMHGDEAAVDVDNAVVTTAPVYKQLLNSFAEEAATEDAIYYLGEGLRRGVIDIEVFLKHVRSLSRKQFFLRALIVKCRQKAGLPV